MRVLGRGVVQKILMAFFLILFIAVMFMRFVYKNNERIISQNAEYISDAAEQKAQRMEYIMRDAQKNLVICADLYGQTIAEGESVDYRELNQLAENAPFDYIGFVSRDGLDVKEDGEIADVSDREYYKRGIQGESGVVAVFDSKLTDGNIIAFYTPLEVGSGIVGVIVGVYKESRIEELLYSSYFGEQAEAYLCTQDGQVVVGSAAEPEEISENIITAFEENGSMKPENVEEMKEALSKGESYGFRYNAARGAGAAYITSIRNTDLMIFQSFPSQITSRMISLANSQGFVLTAELIVALLLYIAGILLISYKQRRRLIRENTEMSYVIEGMKKLFDRFILVDLEHETYQYLAGITPRMARIAPQGDYAALKEYLLSQMLDEEERGRMDCGLSTEAIREGLAGDAVHLCFEYYAKRKKDRWERVDIICLQRKNQVPVQVLFACQDVTEYKTEELKKNAALRDAYQAVEAANQAKSDFLSRMSHDIRTPMNAIMGMTSIAAMSVDDTARVSDCLNKITISSRHLLGLINEVLDMSKIESGKLVLSEEEFNLSETIENLMTIFYPQIEQKKQRLNVSITNIVHEHVVGDAQRLQQVFVNIMGNAIKFTPEDGSISLRIEEKESNSARRGLYEFVFADTGIGMEEEFITHMFEPFVRADDSRVGHTEGTGLGMAIVNSIVHMMNGDIQVKSTPGEGSEFTVSVYLQYSDEKEEDVGKLAGLPILVVDDEPFACENACEMLSDIGMKAEYVTNGDMAIEKMLEAKERGSDYFAVLLDWSMPHKDGLLTAKEIREKLGKEVPIIIISGYDWPAIEQEARAIGVNDFISKPLFKSKLIYLLKKLVDKNQDVTSVKNRLEKKYVGKRVLLAEDNGMNTEIAVHILEMAGFEVDTARDGAIAVQSVKDSPENTYDLIFMDIQMPNMNGYDATVEIRALDRSDAKNVPIIAMSANAFVEDIRNAKEAGMNDYIAKPIEIPKLMDVIAKWVRME